MIRLKANCRARAKSEASAHLPQVMPRRLLGVDALDRDERLVRPRVPFPSLVPEDPAFGVESAARSGA